MLCFFVSRVVSEYLRSLVWFKNCLKFIVCIIVLAVEEKIPMLPAVLGDSQSSLVVCCC